MNYYKELCDLLSRCRTDIAKFVKTHYTITDKQIDDITWYSYELKKPLTVNYNIGTPSGDALFANVVLKSIEYTDYNGYNEIVLITEDDKAIDIFMVSDGDICCLTDTLNSYTDF